MTESDPTVAHSPLGPSSSDRWLNCTASVGFTKGMEDTTSEFAAEGSAAHDLSEWARVEGKPCKSWIGTEIHHDGFVFIVDESMARYVQQFVDYCNDRPGDAYYEERVHYTAFVPDGWGTADDFRIDDSTKVCYMTDLKYGKGVQVYAKGNTQLMLYALGVLQEFGHLYEIKEFKLAIHQPRLDHVDEWSISVKDLLIWARDVVRPAVEEAASGGSFAAGKWCRFCRGKSVCDARSNEYLSDFEDLSETEVPEIPHYRLAEILSKASEIKSWISDVEARALSLVQQGEQVGDYKLVAGRSARYWKDSEAAEQALRGVNKLKVRDIFVSKMVSPAQAEKLLGKKHPVLEEHVAVKQGKPALVPGSDPRPPLQADASEEFDSLD